MPTLADLFNVPREFTFEGTTYAMREPDQIEQGRFQRWLETRVRQAIGRDTEASDEEKAAALDRFYDRQAAGEYEWGNPTCLKALMSWSGWAKYMEIMLNVDPETAKRMVQIPVDELAAAVGRTAAENPKLMGEFLASRGFPMDWLSEISSSFSPTRPSTSRKRKSPAAATSNSSSSGPSTSGTAKDSPSSSPTPEPAPAS
jgi:hypothetical protein